jgi:hypothetical protein
VVTSTLARSLLVVAALALAPQARAGDPFGAAPSGLPSAAPRPFPGAPIAETAPYLNSHPASSAPDFRSGPSTLEDYHYLRNAPPSPEIALYGLVVRDRDPLPTLPALPAFPEPIPPRPQLDVAACSADWFAVNACVLRLYTGEARR